MDEDQNVSISLKEYMELKEVYDHRKEVKITETFKHNPDGGEEQYTGTALSWKSDGKCWSYMTSKLQRQGMMLTLQLKIVRKYTKMEDNYVRMHKLMSKMSVIKFLWWRRKERKEQKKCS